MSLALLCPGQGSQAPGFLHALPQNTPVLQALDEASQSLHQDILTLDTPEALHSTVAVQLTLLTAGVAFTRFLQSEGVTPTAAAGMSIGAFVAAVAAQSLTFPDALLFVRKRAELMETSLATGSGMAVVEGLRESVVRQLLQHSGLTLANFNSPTQFVLAGPRPQLLDLLPRATHAGAHTARLLHSPTASHTPALRPAANELLAFANTLPMRDAAFPIYSNKSARTLVSARLLREDLAFNMAEPVRWHDTTTALAAQGATLFLEAPPGHTLTHLAQQAHPEIKSLAAGETRWDILLREARKLTPGSSGP